MKLRVFLLSMFGFMIVPICGSNTWRFGENLELICEAKTKVEILPVFRENLLLICDENGTNKSKTISIQWDVETTNEAKNDDHVKQNYEAWSERHGALTLLDIRSEIEKLDKAKVEAELRERIKRILQRDLNYFTCKTLKNKAPLGKYFVFQEAENDQWYALVTSGVRKEWTLLTPEGEQIDGDLSIETSHESNRSEINFRRWKDPQSLTSDDWMFITPKTSSVIKEIRSFKKHTRLTADELVKFKRAAYIATDENGWEFQGHHEIDSKTIEYDEETTMYRIQWEDQSDSETLKHESDLIVGDLDVGDRVIYDGNFGIVIEKYGTQCINRVVYDYKVELEEDPLNSARLAWSLTSDKLALWEKAHKRKRKENREEFVYGAYYN